MKYNIEEVASLMPDYLGFIFYEKSPRHIEKSIPMITSTIKKVGVFVDAEIDFISEMVREHGLDIIQLHGEESPELCRELRGLDIKEIWKVFSVKDKFDFSVLKEYENYVDKFLFDTKGKNKGGNGYTFDWSLLKAYPSKKPIVLSGGIGLRELPKIKAVLSTNLPIEVIDVNSQFESKPGLKKIDELKLFMNEL
ncbi:MAG: phosphoribosylanthranilate isomerase [Flavobacteriaceae bacterium]|nr:phosphoribosylanthranilate isomerase [Flavobacteriaceae bacterium]